MSPWLLFVFGVLVFLITVYGTVVVGGLLLTGRQLDDDPALAAGDVAPDEAPERPHPGARRRLVPADY